MRFTVEKDFDLALSLSNVTIRTLMRPVLTAPEVRKVLSPAALRVADVFLKSGDDPLDPIVLAPYLEEYNEGERQALIQISRSYLELANDPVQAERISKGFVEYIQRKLMINLLERESHLWRENLPEFFRRLDEIRYMAVSHFTPKPIGALREALKEDHSNHRIWKPFFIPLVDYLSGGGYLPGELITLAGATGKGKTMFALNEAVNLTLQGAKVLYVALGDMMESDIIRRVVSIYHSQRELKDLDILRAYLEDPSTFFRTPLANYLSSRLNGSLELYWESLDERIHKNLLIYITEPDRLSVEDIYQTLQMPMYQEVDVVIIDYDSNLRTSSNSSSLYQKGEEVYEGLVRIARTKQKNRVVIVLSQVSKMYYSSEYVPIEALAESSRKQAISDVIITIGKNSGDEEYHSGYISLVKNRRGATTRKKYLMLPTGIFVHYDVSSGLLVPGNYGWESS